MISSFQSMLHLATAAALAAGLIGAGVGAIARPAGKRRAVARPACLVGGLVGAAMTFAVAQRELGTLVAGGAAIAAWALALALAIGLGVAGVVVGLRGRWVGDHEHCRRCGFDLFGRPDGTRVCNECGAPLDAPHAIVVGVRHRRPVPLLAGAFVAVLAVAIGGVIVRDAVLQPGGFDWIRYKPTSWLIDDVAALRPNFQFRPVSTVEIELDRRLTSGALSTRDGQRIVAAAMRASAASPIDLFAFDAWAKGIVDEPTMRDLVALRARPTVAIEAISRPERVGYAVILGALDLYDFGVLSGRMLWTIETKERADTINDVLARAEPVARYPRRWGQQPRGLGEMLGRWLRPQTPLPVGPAAVRVRIDATVTLQTLGGKPIAVDVPIDVAGRTTVVE